ncbi:head GIN domain-containing protein [Chloroflexota bacterium]
MYKHRMLVVFVLLALLVGCSLTEEAITGSGKVVPQEEAITGFDKVVVSHAFKADISQGETFSVIVRVDDNLLEYLEVVKQGSNLKIGLTTDRLIRNATLEAEVTMPDLAGVDLSAASQGTVTGFKSPNALDLDLSAASHLRGDIEAGDVRLDASGASQVTLRGSAGDVTIDASGASKVDLADFPGASATVKATDASNVTVNASGTLDVDASGASNVYYVGSPTLGTVETSGASNVEQK